MKTVWKYELKAEDVTTLEMPVGAEILHVHGQGKDSLGLWARVDPTSERKEQRRFRIAGTGHELPDYNLSYIGTAHIFSGALVFHVFEIDAK